MVEGGLTEVLSHTGWIWTAWALLLVLVIYAASFASALTASKKFGERHWISVGPLFAWFVGALATTLMLIQLRDVAAILSRLAQFSGVADLFARAYATAFVALVIVVTARAFYVISEMDNGRYAGEDDLPKAISNSRGVRWWEAAVRLLIIAAITTFAAAFVRIVIPTSGKDIAIAGTPYVLAAVRENCVQQRALLSEIGHGLDEDDCVAERLATLTSSELSKLAETLVEPMPLLLGTCYILMLAWCVLVWRGALGFSERKDTIRNALILQILIPIFAGVNLVIMLAWVHIAIGGEVPFMNVASRDAVTGSLIILSIIGFLISTAGFALLSLRLWTDLKSARAAFGRAVSAVSG